MTTKLTGPAPHPLTARVSRGRKLRRAHYSEATRMLQEHQDRGISDQSVFEAPLSGGRWTLLGPVEDYGQLATQVGYVVVGRRQGGAMELAQRLADEGQRGSQAAAEAALAAADEAAPMVEVLLASAVHAEVLEWDTGESVQRAARRLCLDAGWDLLGKRHLKPRPADIYGWVVTAMSSSTQGREVDELARHYLRRREAVRAKLEELGIEWGRDVLTAKDAAGRAGVGVSTWRAYVYRSQAPGEDAQSGWYRATVDAWRLASPQRDKSWWGR